MFNAFAPQHTAQHTVTYVEKCKYSPYLTKKNNKQMIWQLHIVNTQLTSGYVNYKHYSLNYKH